MQDYFFGRSSDSPAVANSLKSSCLAVSLFPLFMLGSANQLLAPATN